MTAELTLLVWSGVLLFVLIGLASTANTRVKSITWNAGNRDEPAPSTGWPGRADRAYHNMLETLPIFIILVVTAHLANIHSAHTVLGAQLYFWGRVAHSGLYHLGVAYLRTLAWLVSVIGMALILIEILHAAPAA